MAMIVRRAAKKAIISAKDGHGLLGLLIFDEKLVFENFRKLVESKENASLSLLKWTREEENIAVQEVFSKVFEVGSIWTAIMKTFTENHLKYRQAFKEVLREEKELDELRKRELVYTTKLHKLQKQMDQNKKNSATSKSLLDEISEVLSKTEEAHAELEVRGTKHEILKAKTLREALKLVGQSIQTLAEQTLSVGKSYQQLADLIPDTPTQLSEEKVFPGAGKARRIVTELTKEVGYESVPVPVSRGKNDHTYLYAVSPQLPESYDDTGSPPASPAGVRESKQRRSPPQVPVRKPRKISECSLPTQQFSRPESLEDLRPPPSCPPPPLPSHEESPPVKPTPTTRSNARPHQGIQGQKFGKPQSMNDLRPRPAPKPRKVSSDQENQWYARSKTIEGSDSEDSDGYTEVIVEQYHKKSVSTTAGALRSHTNNNNQYAECREQSPWQQENKYQGLCYSTSEDQEDTIQDESQYIELIDK